MEHPDNPVNYGKSLGRVAYEAYSNARSNKTHDGKDMPTWDDLNDVQIGWDAAARAVADMMINNRGTKVPDHRTPSV